MKDQYVGDIGDYTKLALLRVLENAGFSIGVNWYLTDDDLNSKDGRHIEYLCAPCDTPDQELYNTLYDIVKVKKMRSIDALMESNLLHTRLFYKSKLEFSAYENRSGKRVEWHNQAITSLQSADIVFLDPDNGLTPDGVGPYARKRNKYVTYEEVAEYYNSGKTVIVYSHRDRSPIEKYLERLCRFSKDGTVAKGSLLCLYASRYSPRDYLFLMQQRPQEKIVSALNDMLKTCWNKYLKCREL